jgi:hypothetical protein
MSSQNFGSILKYLGFHQGVDSLLNGQKAYEWFRMGGQEEDFLIIRAYNHFHRPPSVLACCRVERSNGYVLTSLGAGFVWW